MSSNGQSPDPHVTWNPEVTLSGVPLSAAQREAQRIAYVQAVDTLAKVLGRVVESHDWLLVDYHKTMVTVASLSNRLSIAESRGDALENVTAQRWNLPLWYRLRWLVLGR